MISPAQTRCVDTPTPAAEPLVDPTDQALAAEIRQRMNDKTIAAFDRRRQIAALVTGALVDRGRFSRTGDGRLFFFATDERRLYDLRREDFDRLMAGLSGLSTTEVPFGFTKDQLLTRVSRTGPLVPVHTFAAYDAATGRLVLSDGGAGGWARSVGGEWEPTDNGVDGALFLTEPEATPWEPEFPGSGADLDWFLGAINFAHHGLSPDDQRAALGVYLLQLAFPPLRRTRMIPTFLGPMGSGKSTAERLIGRLILGPAFDVSGLQRDKEDTFIAAVTNRVVHGVDNADARVPWLEDALATYATGHRYRLRRLYTTNEEDCFDPRAILLLNSRDPRFNRPDVAERILPLHLERLAAFKPEESLFSELARRRSRIWADLLVRAAAIQDALQTVAPPILPFRMADFAGFGWVVAQQRGDAQAWVAFLQRLERGQMEFAAAGDGLIFTLAELLEQGNGSVGPVTTAELLRQLQPIADREGWPMPKGPIGLGHRITTLRRVIESELGVVVQDVRGGARVRRLTISRTPKVPQE